MRALAVLSAALLSAACGSTPAAGPTQWSFDPARLEALGVEHFPGGAAVLSGFAPADDDPAMRVGDAALLGVEIRNGDNVDRVLLLLEVTSLMLDGAIEEATGKTVRMSYIATHTTQKWNPITRSLGAPEETSVTVHPVRVALTRLDADGRPQQVSEATLFEEGLAAGFWPRVDRTTSEQDDAFSATLTRTLSGLVNGDAVLQDLMFRIVEKPSLWSIARHFGVAVTLIWTNYAEPEPVQLAGVAMPVRRVPLEVNINGEPGLFVDLAVAQPNGATRACAGLVGALARHPNDASRFAVVRLLATRRGPRVP